jgi:hypothetical protein
LTHWPALFSSAVLNGVWLSLILTLIMIISGLIALDMWVGDYPPDIRARYGPMSARAARARPFVAVAVFGTVLVVPMLGLFALESQLGSVPAVAAGAFAAIALLVFNLYDLLILDWLFFCTLQPRAMVLPGTEGMAGYRDYRFHFIGFLKGLGFCFAAGVIVAGLWLLLQALL